MESKGLLTSLQESSTGTYPEPDQSSPYHPILSLQDPFLAHFPNFEATSSGKN
jgi:hypothetical protein